MFHLLIMYHTVQRLYLFLRLRRHFLSKTQNSNVDIRRNPNVSFSRLEEINDQSLKYIYFSFFVCFIQLPLFFRSMLKLVFLLNHKANHHFSLLCWNKITHWSIVISKCHKRHVSGKPKPLFTVTQSLSTWGWGY